MNMNSEHSERAFTLIELLVVISIIGILATLVTANLNAARARARDAARKSDLKNIQTALRMYYNDNSAYPISVPFGSEFTSPSDVVYMNIVPHDPLYNDSDETPVDYVYTRLDDDNFTLLACLENQSDANCNASCDSGCGYQITP